MLVNASHKVNPRSFRLPSVCQPSSRSAIEREMSEAAFSLPLRARYIGADMPGVRACNSRVSSRTRQQAEALSWRRLSGAVQLTGAIAGTLRRSLSFCRLNPGPERVALPAIWLDQHHLGRLRDNN